MEIETAYIKNLIMFKKEEDLIRLINSGWDPNYEGGWPIRLAARYGCCSIVEAFIRHGANPHTLSKSGASTLQLAVYSREHWDTDRWSFLLSCCDSSQLADGAAVAIVFSNNDALQKIIETRRCNTHIPTTLTGKTIEQLAKGYKLLHMLDIPMEQAQVSDQVAFLSPRTARSHRSDTRNTLIQPQAQRNLSPSVARFFQQTVGQPSLTSPRRTAVDDCVAISPGSQLLHY